MIAHTVNLSGPRSTDGANVSYAFPLDLDQYTRASQDALRTSTVQNGVADDSLFDAAGAWNRYRYSWHHGAGQRRLDLDVDSSPFRFDASDGVDVWNEGQLRLLPDRRVVRDADVTYGPMIVIGTQMFVADGEVLRVYDYAHTSAHLPFEIPVEDGGIQALASDGSTLYVGSSAGLRTVAPFATEAVTLSAGTNVSTVTFASNRLLIGNNQHLREVAANGTTTAIITHRQATFRWTVIFSIGSRLYAGGYAGDRSELYTLTTDTTGALVRGVEAVTFAPGEQLRSALPVAGLVVLASNRGVRLATPNADGTLTYGPNIHEVGDYGGHLTAGVSDHPDDPDNAAGFVWCTYGDDERGGVIRLDLATFVEPLRPAVAWDVMQLVDAGKNERVVGIARFEATTYFATVQHLFGNYSSCTRDDFIVNAQAPHSTPPRYVTQGWIDSGQIYFGTVEDKAIVGLTVDFEPLPAGTSVVAEVSNERGETIASGTASTVGQERLFVSADGPVCGWCRLKLTLSSPGGLATPVVTHWRMRAYPIAPPVDQWVLPLRIRSKVKAGQNEGQTISMNVQERIDQIIDWWRTKRTLTLRHAGHTYLGRIDGYQMADPRWDEDGSSIACTMLVKIVQTSHVETI